jgi:hypothetical protein
MNDGIANSRAQLADMIGLQIQELHAGGRLRGGQPLLRIDNREQARTAPYQFDAARGRLHRADCRSIPKSSKSALYGVWQIAKEEETLTCPRCNPMPKPDEKSDQKPQDETPIDLLYGVLSVISQFGGVLRERGQEYRNSRAGALLGAQIDKIYNGVNEREKNILDVLASSLGSLAVAIRGLDEGLNGAGAQDTGKPAGPESGGAP